MNEDPIEEAQRLLFLAKQERSDGQFESAKEKIVEAQKFLGSVDDGTQYEFLSVSSYELAYIERSEGQYQNAAEIFLDSCRFGKLAGDHTADWASRQLRAMTLYFGDVRGASETYAVLNELNREFQNLPPAPREKTGFRKSFDFTNKKNLADLAFECGDKVALSLLKGVVDHELVVAGATKNAPTFALSELKMQTRIKMLQGQHEEAVALFCIFMDVEVPGLSKSVKRPENPSLMDFCRTWLQEMAIEYRDFGRALMKSDIDGKEAAAKAAWNAGLRWPDGAGNLRFKNQIRKELQNL